MDWVEKQKDIMNNFCFSCFKRKKTRKESTNKLFLLLKICHSNGGSETGDVQKKHQISFSHQARLLT